MKPNTQTKKPLRLYSPAFYEKRIKIAVDKIKEVSAKRKSVNASAKKTRNLEKILARRAVLVKNGDKKALARFTAKYKSYIGDGKSLSLRKVKVLNNRLNRRIGSLDLAIKNLNARVTMLKSKKAMSQKRAAARKAKKA